MKNILLIGVGGTGSKAVDIFFQKYHEFKAQTDNKISALVFDTDAGDVAHITDATTVAMADNASVGTICDRFGKEFLREWFPCDDKAIRSQEMIRGASQWRKKSYLAFLNLMNKPLARGNFIGALEKMVADPGSSCEVYVVTSIAGGTGSGSFIPIALYAKRYLRKNLGKDPIVNAMIAMPDIYADAQTPEIRIKVYANAYAILRELNAINLVARNYNAGRTAQKKSPIRFRIGHPDEPNVGLLFDASDPQFWTPEAAPFSQIFLLDKIPNLNSVTAHNMVMANSLYTILCTEIGAAFDSEFSNHELLRSQSNGSNAIYAGVSTSQIRFPVDSILNYLAHRKTLESCDQEMLLLHKKVEGIVKTKEQEAKAARRRFTMEDDEYEQILLQQTDELEASNNDVILSIVERCLDPLDKEGKKKTPNDVERYLESLDEYINGKIPEFDRILNRINQDINATRAKNRGKVTTDDVNKLAVSVGNAILSYFKTCVDGAKKASYSLADSVLTFDKKKTDFVVEEQAVVNNLLIKNGKHIHPVAAMIQLCRLRVELTKRIEEAGGANPIWESAFKSRNLNAIPKDLTTVNRQDGYTETLHRNRSKYYNLGMNRFADMTAGAYLKKVGKGDGRYDLNVLELDCKNILAYNLCYGAQAHLRAVVYKALAENVSLLIKKYRNFFNRFEKEKEDLEEATKTAIRRDAVNVDSVINVYSSEEDKKKIYDLILEQSGPVTEAELIETDNIVGVGVFNSVYASASAAASKDDTFNDKDSSAYRSLFANMIKAYSESVAKNEVFEQIANYNVVEAIVASNADGKKDEAFRSKFSVAQELAIPSLRIDRRDDLTELVQPSDITVFMMSENTARYLKKNADELGLVLPADQAKESTVIQACAEQFIRRFSGNNSARVSIVKTMEDNMLYCTGEIMDITPLRIPKINEIGEDNVYFRNYSIAIENIKKYNTDMWNPHIGNDLYKRGYLPYMNEDKEKECDVQMVKALFYGFAKNKIKYADSIGEFHGMYFFTLNGKKITDPEGRWIKRQNIAQLLAWLRNEDELIARWSREFDADIERQKNSLPSLASENEIPTLEAALTNLDFSKLLNVQLFEDPEKEYKNGKGPSIIEFAYMVKTSEELGTDCDDAERLISVAYDIFKEICAHRTIPEANPERFIQVYRQQLDHVYEGLAESNVVWSAKKECVAHYQQLVNWINLAGLFNTISKDNAMDEKGRIIINTPYDYNEARTTKIAATLKKIEGIKDEAAPAAAPAAEPAAEASVEADA